VAPPRGAGVRASAAALALLFPLAASAEAPAVKSLTLRVCVETALERNFALIQARELIRQRTGAYAVARAALLPSLDARGEFSRTDPKKLSSFGGSTFGHSDNWSAGVELSQPLFSGGAGAALRGREAARRDAAAHEYESEVNRVLLLVHERFYAVLLRREQVLVREEAVRLLEAEVEAERRKRDVGSVSDFNVLRVEVELANSRTPLIRARNELRLAGEELRAVLGLTGKDAPGEISAEGTLRFEPLEAELETAIAKARENRPELNRLRRLVFAQEENITLQRADYLPSLKGTAAYDIERDRFAPKLGDVNRGWTLGVRGDWNLFDGLASRAKIDSARSELASARAALAEQEAKVEIEARRAYSSLIEARELVAASSKVSESAREALRLSRARFAADVATQLDVFAAQVALTDARANEVQAVHDYNLAVARLRQAVGDFVSPKS